MMSENTLTDINAYEIIDNRGMPTIRVAVCIDNQIWGKADVPSGSSTGSYEAMEMRDGAMAPQLPISKTNGIMLSKRPTYPKAGSLKVGIPGRIFTVGS